MIVTDASAILEVLINGSAAQRVLARLFADGESLHAPHLLDVEVLQVLRRYSMSKEFDPDRGEAAVRDFLDLPVHRYPHEPLVRRVWELRNNLTAYDAAYVALAEALDAPLVTRDRRLAASKGHGAEIEVV